MSLPSTSGKMAISVDGITMLCRMARYICPKSCGALLKVLQKQLEYEHSTVGTVKVAVDI